MISLFKVKLRLWRFIRVAARFRRRLSAFCGFLPVRVVVSNVLVRRFRIIFLILFRERSHRHV